MTAPLYRTAPYAREAHARITALTPAGGLVPDVALFYPAGGGQPGDSGVLEWDGGSMRITDTLKVAGGGTMLIPEAGAALPPVGAAVTLRLNWERRFAHMRVHTALHLLSVVIPLPVTGGQIGGQIGPGRGRLDFDMPEPPDGVAELEAALNSLIGRNLPVDDEWITDQELAANPGLVKTMSVRPPTGTGQVRLIAIGVGAARVDLQPCGGTHVANTTEIGRVTIGKIENKGRQNRRVVIHLAEPTTAARLAPL